MRIATTKRMRRLTKLEASRVLQVPLSLVDALIDQKAIPAALGTRELEAYFRDGLIRLYRTEAAPEAQPLAVPYAEVEIPSKPVEELEAKPVRHQRPNLRVAPRYEPRRQIGGTFREVKFSVLQISATGLRVRHDETLRPGDEALVSIALLRPAQTIVIRARVAWTSIAQTREGGSFCISGLAVTHNREQLRQVIDQMKKAREMQIEGNAVGAARTPPALVGLSDDDVAAIIRAHRKLSSDPVEASRWYTRARFALNEAEVRKAAPERARDREEVLGLWEYLERKIPIGTVTSVVSWLRQTRSAAAV